MVKPDSLDPGLWLKRAKSNLALGKSKNVIKDPILDDVFYDDACFELQQCAEKSLKALLLYNRFDIPATHSISQLIALLEANNIIIPLEIKEASILTTYAVRTRYPDDYIQVSKEKYNEALIIAESVYKWVEKQII